MILLVALSKHQDAGLCHLTGLSLEIRVFTMLDSFTLIIEIMKDERTMMQTVYPK